MRHTYKIFATLYFCSILCIPARTDAVDPVSTDDGTITVCSEIKKRGVLLRWKEQDNTSFYYLYRIVKKSGRLDWMHRFDDNRTNSFFDSTVVPDGKAYTYIISINPFDTTGNSVHQSVFNHQTNVSLHSINKSLLFLPGAYFLKSERYVTGYTFLAVNVLSALVTGGAAVNAYYIREDVKADKRAYEKKPDQVTFSKWQDNYDRYTFWKTATIGGGVSFIVSYLSNIALALLSPTGYKGTTDNNCLSQHVHITPVFSVNSSLHAGCMLDFNF